jgi:hypothetical protein
MSAVERDTVTKPGSRIHAMQVNGLGGKTVARQNGGNMKIIWPASFFSPDISNRQVLLAGRQIGRSTIMRTQAGIKCSEVHQNSGAGQLSVKVTWQHQESSRVAVCAVQKADLRKHLEHVADQKEFEPFHRPRTDFIPCSERCELVTGAGPTQAIARAEGKHTQIMANASTPRAVKRDRSVYACSSSSIKLTHSEKAAHVARSASQTDGSTPRPLLFLPLFATRRSRRYARFLAVSRRRALPLLPWCLDVSILDAFRECWRPCTLRFYVGGFAALGVLPLLFKALPVFLSHSWMPHSLLSCCPKELSLIVSVWQRCSSAREPQSCIL